MKRQDNDFEKLYNFLLDSEDLHVMYKGLSGDWEKDKKKFIKYQLELEQFANAIEVDVTE